MKVTFIAHAGISIEEGGVRILIDPWFTSSNLETPVLEGLLSHRTIDFQTPHGGVDVSRFAPADAVFLSHLHTHHAPKKDLLNLLAARQPHSMFFGHPKLKPENAERITELFRRTNAHVALHGFTDNGTLQVGPFTIRARTHTVPGHLGWHVSSATGSILHIADPVGHRDHNRMDLDPLWDTFAEYRPDILFFNASGNTMRSNDNGVPTIREARCLMPGQAAMLAQKLNPAVVSLIGCYNKSVWNGTTEYVRPGYIIEDEFYWGVRWTAPKVRCVFARPGHTYAIRERENVGVDTYIL